ncbi:cation diffusion facilitator family transporter [Thermodesulfobacteriota bacterium]
MNSNSLDPTTLSYQVRRITWVGLAVNLLLAVIKFIVGIMGSSQAVVADAVHSLSDMATDIAVLLGVGFWTAPADEDHPYGHWRIESLVTIIIGVSLVIVALGIGYKALSTIREVDLKQPGWIAIIGVLFSIILKEMLFRWTLHIGKSTKSSALIANAWHHRSDAISSIPAFIAVAAATINPKWAFIDHVGALLVAVIILKVSWDIVVPAFSVLIDRGASQKERNKIRSIAMTIDEVEHIHAIRTRRVGAGFHVDLHVQVDGEMTVSQGHDICGKVKHALLEDGPEILDVVVHLEPYD